VVTAPGYVRPSGSTAVTDATRATASPTMIVWPVPAPPLPVMVTRCSGPSLGAGQQKASDCPVVSLVRSLQSCEPGLTWSGQIAVLFLPSQK
jgi:hypothetical protein